MANPTGETLQFRFPDGNLTETVSSKRLHCPGGVVRQLNSVFEAYLGLNGELDQAGITICQFNAIFIGQFTFADKQGAKAIVDKIECGGN